jgi:histidyl-tRNA synthetase
MSTGNKTPRLQAVKGMVDMLPPQSRRLREVERVSHEVLATYGYSEVRTPVVEYTPLFSRSIGEATDIVEKEMYTFEDRDGRSLSLRPEGTASAVRAYVEHAVHQQEPLSRWYYLGPMFRHERAQRGRYRQFFQLGVEALGAAEPGIDAEMIAMLLALLERLGLAGADVHLNTLGCPECRPAFRHALVDYLAPHEAALCEDCRRRFRENPLRVLDCKVEGCRTLAAGAPTALASTCDVCRGHFEGLLADLAVLDVPYQIDHRLVRGLDYYTRTTFEVLSTADGLGSQNTIAGGGRYDLLVEELGGPPTPAVGFAMGMERLLLALGEDRPPLPPLAQVCLVTHGDEPRREGLRLARELRGRGVTVDMDHRGASVKSQMKRAHRLGSSLVLLLGEAEQGRGVVALRDMATSEQEEVPLAEVLARALSRLGPSGGG